ncbi:MAG: hypothetical protein GXY32_00350 [Ruminococcaceae bacterium]|nr:hypothetical protein [Oscillospiraceae bacterium]
MRNYGISATKKTIQKMCASLLAVVMLISFASVPVFAAEPPLKPPPLAEYNSADVQVINTLIQKHPALMSRYALNEPWSWTFATFEGEYFSSAGESGDYSPREIRLTDIQLTKENAGNLNAPLYLSGLSELRTLALYDVGITEIHLQNLPKIESFDASGNKIRDLDLTGIPSVSLVSVDRNFYNTSWGKNVNTFESVNIKGCNNLSYSYYGFHLWGSLQNITNKLILEDGNTITFKHPQYDKIRFTYHHVNGREAGVPGTLSVSYFSVKTFKSWKMTPSTVKFTTPWEPISAQINTRKYKNFTVSVVENTPASTASKVTPSTQFPQTAVRIGAGKSIVIPATAYASTGKASKITYTSTNPDVATVSQAGKITAKTPGITTIVAKAANGKTDKLKVTVLKKTAKTVRVKSVTANVPSSMKVGKRKKVDGKYQSTSATAVQVTFSSNNKSVVTVDKGGLLIAKKKGTAVITVKAGGKTAKYTVTVE